MSTPLLIFLLVDVFLAGVIAATALRHALAHFRPDKHDAEKHRPVQPAGPLPPAMKARLLETAQADFQKVLAHSAMQLQRDLGATEARLSHKLESLGEQIVAKQMASYRAELDKLHEQTETVEKNIETDGVQHQAELKAKLEEDIAAEKQRLIQQIDTKLGDAVASFLLDTMQRNVDLGAQTSYILKTLEEHKADFIQGVDGGKG